MKRCRKSLCYVCYNHTHHIFYINSHFVGRSKGKLINFNDNIYHLSVGCKTWVPVIDGTLITRPDGPLSTIWTSTRGFLQNIKSWVNPNFPWFVISLSSLHPSTFPLVIWHCRRRRAFRTFFVPGERRREAAMGGGDEGVGCKADKERGSTLLAFNKRHPQHFPYTHIRSPRSRKGRSRGWRGSGELEEGEIKEIAPHRRCPSTIHPLSSVRWVPSLSQTPFFSHGARRRKTLLYRAPPPLSVHQLLNLTLASRGGTWFIVPLTCSKPVASCFGTGGCQSQNGTWIMSHPSCITG